MTCSKYIVERAYGVFEALLVLGCEPIVTLIPERCYNATVSRRLPNFRVEQKTRPHCLDLDTATC